MKSIAVADLLGKTEEDANQTIKSAGFRVRVIRRDGTRFVVTMDLRGDRVNLSIENGKVVAAEIG